MQTLYKKLILLNGIFLLKLIFTLLLVFGAMVANASSKPSIQDWTYDECENTVTFKMHVRYTWTHGAWFCDNEYHYLQSGKVRINVGGDYFDILDLHDDHRNGWSYLHGIWYNRLVNFVEVSNGGNSENNRMCSANGGPERYYFMTVKVKLPASYSGNGQSVFVRIVGDWQSSGNSFDQISSTLTMPIIDRPTNLQAVSDCDEVRLSWDRPNFHCPNDVDFVVYRDQSQIGIVGYNDPLNFVDDDGSTLPYKPGGYDYDVRLRFKSAIHDLSDAVSASANPKRQFDNPNYFQNVELNVLNECNRSIKLDWEIEDDVNFQQFVVERHTDPAFPNATTEELRPFVTNAPFSYTDNDVPVDERYYYRVRAYDECGNDHIVSSTQQILFEGKPAPPSITDITPLANGTVRINFNHDNEKVEKFKVYRDGIQIGNDVLEGTLTDYEFIDTDASNCITYRYRVDAIGKCYQNDPARSQDVEQQISFNTELNGFENFKVSKFYYTDKINLSWEITATSASQVIIFRKREGSGDFYKEIARLPVPSSYYEDYDTEPGILYNYGIMAIACEGYVPVSSEYNSMVTDLGGRSEFGIINGKITYEGGNAVSDVRVIASPTAGESRGVSLNMNGTYLSIPLTETGDYWFPENDWTASFWTRIEDKNTTEILKVGNGTDSLKIVPIALEAKTINEYDYVPRQISVPVEDEIAGYMGAVDSVLRSKIDQSILGYLKSDNSFNHIEKNQVVGTRNNDTIYHFGNGRPWLYFESDEDTWYGLSESNTSLPVPDSLIGYMRGDTIYDGADSDFVLAFISGVNLRLAQHYNIRYELGDQYGFIKQNKFYFSQDTNNVATIIDDMVYDQNGDPIHQIKGNNVYYVYRDFYNNRLVRGKRIGRKVENTDDPGIAFDVFYLEKSVTEEIRNGQVLGIVNDERTKVFESGGAGLTNYLIDEYGILRTAVYRDTTIYEKDEALYSSSGKSPELLINLSDGTSIAYLQSPNLVDLYSLQVAYDFQRNGDYIEDAAGTSVYKIGSLIDGLDYQVFHTTEEEQTVYDQVLTDSYTKEVFKFEVQIDQGGTVSTMRSDSICIGDFSNITLRYDGSDLVLFINGKPNDTLSVSGINDIFITGTPEMTFGSFDGFLDEILIWDIAKPLNDIQRDHNRYLTGGEENLEAYWRVNEGVSNNVFDAAFTVGAPETEKYHEHQGVISRDDSWSSEVPDQELLSFTSYTDEEGNYSIRSIFFTGEGNNFRVVPIYESHQFYPSNEVLFLGKTEQVHNQIDFEDRSSFTVTGTVKYDPRILGFEDIDDPDAPNCYVEGVEILVDDEPVIADAQIVTTDKDGRFEIEVPIGNHNISIRKNNHHFVFDSWPPEGTFDFQQDQFDLVFNDKTTRRLVGKIVGGVTEGIKHSGFGEAVNNVGKAEITLKSIGKTCFETKVETDSSTGEYAVLLPPFRYNITDLRIPSQDVSFNRELRKLAEGTIDLRPDLMDTLYLVKSDTFPGIPPEEDSTLYYHLIKDFIYRANSEMLVASIDPNYPDANAFFGEKQVDIGGNTLDFQSASLPYPVFIATQPYGMEIAVSESYTNLDHDPPVDYYDTIRTGVISIENNIGEDFAEYDLADYDGLIPYIFTAKKPSILADVRYPERSFTKTLQIVGPNNITWRDEDDLFRAYVFGQVSDPSRKDFYTVRNDSVDYQVVDFILRDPPGSQSYAKLSEKAKITKISKASLESGVYEDGQALFGAAFEMKSILTGVENADVKFGLGFRNNVSELYKKEMTSAYTYENAEEVTTSDINIQPGAGSDIFIGSGMNIYFNPAYTVGLVPQSECGVESECFDITFDLGGTNYSIGRNKSVEIDVDEVPTYFYYTQRQIEQEVADLEENIQFVDPTNVKYDKLRNQINIWKSTLAKNEYDKIVAKDAMERELESVEAENLSFAFGSTVDRSYRLSEENSFGFTRNYSWYAGFSFEYEGAMFFSYQKIKFDIGKKTFVSDNETATAYNEREIAFSLEDNDPGDRLSVDVVLTNPANIELDGSYLDQIHEDYENAGSTAAGSRLRKASVNFADSLPVEREFINPIYFTRGGRTSCPYEPELKTKYLTFLPDHLKEDLSNRGLATFDFYGVADTVTIADGTFKRDQPGLRIEPRVQSGIPWDQRAIFDIILENHNVEDTIRTYKLFVDQRTTGAGPTMRLDGERFIKGTDIPLYGGEQLTKSFTLRPVRDVYDYEDIVVYLVAGCQFDFGQDLDFQEDIFARDTFSVYFDPVCPTAMEIAPTPGWIINNNSGSKLEVEIQEQEFYFENHSKVKLQYKSAYQSDDDWVDIAIWTRDSVEVEEMQAIGENFFYFPVENNYIVYEWETADYPTPDGEYQIRWKYYCINGLESQSAVIPGIIDRTSPHAFGRPSPADGILSPNDEILLTLNEPIEEGLVDRDLIRVSGKVNGTPLAHPVSVRFNAEVSDRVVFENFSLNKIPITFEMWVRKDQVFADQEEVLLYQGRANESELELSLTSDGRLKFRVNNAEVVSDDPVALGEWTHISFSYDPNNNKAALYRNASRIGLNTAFIALHQSDAPLVIGGVETRNFEGNLHEVRLWNQWMIDTDLAPNFYKDLTGREIGIIGYWPLNEGFGELAQDKVQGRNASVTATWAVEPTTMSFAFDGANYLEMPGVAVASTEDFTIECWFKLDDLSISDRMNLFNTGDDESIEATNTLEWSVSVNDLGQIILEHHEEEFIAVDQSVLDQQWHHFSMVVNRIGHTSFYLDAQLQNSFSASEFAAFGGARIWVGAQRHSNIDDRDSTVYSYSSFMNGKIDEFRFWGVARSTQQIERDAHYKLNGEEMALKSYMPFENYNDFLRITEGSLEVSRFEKDPLMAEATTALYSLDHPPVMQMPEQTPVYFEYATNGNQILISLDEDNPATVENCILDISVRNLIDENGNVMESPITWSVYVDRNQVTWKDTRIVLTKAVNEALEFHGVIKNEGGENQAFEITNLPPWLSASPDAGELEPNSELTITFSVNSGLNIGKYAEPIYLTSDFGFNETFILDLQVYQELPEEWQFNPEAYQYSMSMIGMVRIDQLFSTDPADAIGAFVNDTIRGLANLEYMEVYDNYQAFLNIYSNNVSGDQIEFRVWDASTGTVLSDVEAIGADSNPVIFSDNSIQGIPGDPIVFQSQEQMLRQIDIPQGWKWISFNLTSPTLSRTSDLFRNHSNSEGDRILSETELDVYDAINDLWIGNIAADNLPAETSGFDLASSYRIFMSDAGTISFEGAPIETQSFEIQLTSSLTATGTDKWNWISFLGQENMDVNEALATIQPSPGDIIKSQHAFAVFDPVLKWIGNLEFLKPGEGYMIKVQDEQTLIFPESGLITAREEEINKVESLYEQWDFNIYQFEDNMSLVAQLDDDLPITENYVLAAYVGDQLVGLSRPVIIPESSKHQFYINIYGPTDLEEVYFKLQSAEGTFLLKEKLRFKRNALLGTADEPFSLSLMDEAPGTELIVYPNPFEQELKVLVPLNVDKHLDIKILSLEGKVILEKSFSEVGENYLEFSWDGKDNHGNQVAAGTYIIEMFNADLNISSVVIKE